MARAAVKSRGGSGKDVGLPVLVEPARSRISKWRVGVLIGVHVLIIAHLTHWMMRGTTLAPAVLSESMYTLEQGELNPGFILFVIALLVTLLLGRFLCGWACHMGALQDLCAWILRKFGIKPMPFRSRLLGWVPIMLAIYMFVWPTFKREMLGPFLVENWPKGLEYIGAVGTFPGWSSRLVTDDLWRGLPTVAVAIPFLLICGCVTVYFLGARGFCRYGCPYGGLLGPADRLAPGRVVVNSELCDSCGRCTASCTNGIRVLDDLRAYGAVMDKACVKTLDCVSVCPQNAIKLRFTRPSLFKRSKVAGQQMGWIEEIAVFAVFWATFYAIRGVYLAVPMLMDVGIAICISLIAFKGWRIVLRKDVWFQKFALKDGGRLRRAGVVFGLFAILVGTVVIHSGIVNQHRRRAQAFDDQVTVPGDVIFAGRFDVVDDEMRNLARRAIEQYHKASGMRYGGMGLVHTEGFDTRLAWLHLVRAEVSLAAVYTERAAAARPRDDELAVNHARVLLMSDDVAGALAFLEGALAFDENLDRARGFAAQCYVQAGRFDDAEGLLVEAVKRSPRDVAALRQLGGLYMNTGRFDLASGRLEAAIEIDGDDAGLRNDLAVALLYLGEADRAIEELKAAAEIDAANAGVFYVRIGQVLEQFGRGEEAKGWYERAGEGHRP